MTERQFLVTVRAPSLLDADNLVSCIMDGLGYPENVSIQAIVVCMVCGKPEADCECDN